MFKPRSIVITPSSIDGGKFVTILFGSFSTGNGYCLAVCDHPTETYVSLLILTFYSTLELSLVVLGDQLLELVLASTDHLVNLRALLPDLRSV
eukprot:9477335-Pyramimonas_sp.AAC.3